MCCSDRIVHDLCSPIYTKRSVRIFYQSDRALNLGFEISKDLRFEDRREYGSDSFSSIEFKIVGKKVTQRILEKGGEMGRILRPDYSNKKLSLRKNLNSKMSVKILCKIKQTVIKLYPSHCSITKFFQDSLYCYRCNSTASPRQGEKTGE